MYYNRHITRSIYCVLYNVQTDYTYNLLYIIYARITHIYCSHTRSQSTCAHIIQCTHYTIRINIACAYAFTDIHAYYTICTYTLCRTCIWYIHTIHTNYAYITPYSRTHTLQMCILHNIHAYIMQYTHIHYIMHTVYTIHALHNTQTLYNANKLHSLHNTHTT